MYSFVFPQVIRITFCNNLGKQNNGYISQATENKVKQNTKQ